MGCCVLKDDSVFQVGDRVLFEYNCWKSSESKDAELWFRTGKCVDIVGVLREDLVDVEEVGYMYKVKFDDGFVGDVFDDEISFSRGC